MESESHYLNKSIHNLQKLKGINDNRGKTSKQETLQEEK